MSPEPLGELRPRGLGRKDRAALALLGLGPLVLFGSILLAGRALFWSDLTYLNHPWRALPAEMVHRGMLPLWDPYAYLGMPLAADLQTATWYPGTLLFHLFGFPSALSLFLGLHVVLCAVFTYLWLRRLGFSRQACLAASLALSLCGWTMSRLPFPNIVSTLAFFPAFLLFWDKPWPLALSLCAAFLSGYPQMLAGQAAAAWAGSGLLGMARRPPGRSARSFWAGHAARWSFAALLSLGLGSVLLVPAAELIARSERGTGVDQSVALSWSFALKDLRQFLSPLLIPRSDFDPLGSWWKTAYWGLAACSAAALGLWRLRRPARAAACAYLGAVLLVILGGTNPASRLLWTSLWPLRFVRYPGNMAFLAMPAVVFLVACGLQGRRAARWWAAAIGLELLLHAWGLQPTLPKGYYADAGPVVRTLRSELGGHRYLLSPRALLWTRGSGPDRETATFDLKHRLYGLSNVPFHLPSVSNLGDPLVPAGSSAFMDLLFTRSGLADVAPWLGWADVGLVMTRERKEPGPLVYLGDSLWHLYRNAGPAARAFWLDERTGAALPAAAGPAAPDVKAGVPLELRRPREDRFSVSGSFPEPGWLFVSEPLWPGWRTEGAASAPGPALSAFQKLRVPAGPWTVRFLYDPPSLRLGLGLSLLSLAGACAFWFARLSRKVSLL